MIEELREKCNAPEKRVGKLALPSEDVMDVVKGAIYDDLVEARKLKGKQIRNDKVAELREKVLHEHFALPEGGDYVSYKHAETRRKDAVESFRKLEKKITHMLIAEHGIRAEGRGLDVIRDIEMEPSIFPRTHGSAFFQRGETQSLVTCVLGTLKGEQIVDGLMPEYAKKFYLHYNFPPFCVPAKPDESWARAGENSATARLPRSHLLGILPSSEDFPYTIRLVSDITESNGSSSMASVCGGCLALMDAGVPIINICAGISVGRFTSSAGKVTHVTDILGEEDFFGEMDFKVSGTVDGITGIQLDLKARGLDLDEIEVIFEQAKTGRLQIIDQMKTSCRSLARTSRSTHHES